MSRLVAIQSLKRAIARFDARERRLTAMALQAGLRKRRFQERLRLLIDEEIERVEQAMRKDANVCADTIERMVNK